MHAPVAPEGGVDVDAMAALMESRAAAPRGRAHTSRPTPASCNRSRRSANVAASSTCSISSTHASRSANTTSTSTASAATSCPRRAGSSCAARVEPASSTCRTARSPPATSRCSSTCAAHAGRSRMRYEPVATAARFEDWEFPYAAVLGAAAATRYALDVGMEPIAGRAPRSARGSAQGCPQIAGVACSTVARALRDSSRSMSPAGSGALQAGPRRPRDQLGAQLLEYAQLRLRGQGSRLVRASVTALLQHRGRGRNRARRRRRACAPLVLQERRRLELVVAARVSALTKLGAAPARPRAEAGRDHRHPDLAGEPFVDRRAEDDLRVVVRRLRG